MLSSSTLKYPDCEVVTSNQSSLLPVKPAPKPHVTCEAVPPAARSPPIKSFILYLNADVPQTSALQLYVSSPQLFVQSPHEVTEPEQSDLHFVIAPVHCPSSHD